MLGQTSCCSPESTLCQLLNGKRNKRDEEDDEDGDDTTLNPVHDRGGISAACWHELVGDWDLWVVHAGDCLVSKSSEVDQRNGNI